MRILSLSTAQGSSMPMEQKSSPHVTAKRLIAQEDLHRLTVEMLQVLVIAFIILGAMLVLLAEPLSGFSSQGWGRGKEFPILGIVLVVMSIIAYVISVRSLQVGVLALIGGLGTCILMGLSWGLGSGTLSLLLLPVSIALLLTGTVTSFLISSGTILTVLYAPFIPVHHSDSERFVLAVLIAAIWILFVLVEMRRAQVEEGFLSRYIWINRQLEEARDDRVRIRQLNEDLAQAYGQLRRLNEMLQASKLEAEAARRAKEEFVAKVSHELRTPLNMVIGFSEMIISSPSTYGAEIPRALLSDIGVIYRNSQHLSQLINDVLVLSQVNAGQMRLTRAWVTIGEIIGEAVHAIEPLFRMKGLALDVILPEAPLPVFCDKLRIRQVLLNLLSNAGRHTTAGGATIRVESSDYHLTVAVQDTGPGIAPEHQKRVFEPFQQIDEPGGEHYTGSGLGLTISMNLVQLHGGRMWLESEVNRGSIFSFSLPLLADDFAKYRVVFPENPYSTYLGDERRSLPQLPTTKDRLIVLESEHNLGQHLAALLPEAEVITIDDVRALTDEIHQNPPTAVIINDEGAMDDVRFSRRLLNLPDRTPILSCYVPGHKEAFHHLNIVDYLVKPITRAQLLEVVAGVVEPGSAILCVEDNTEVARLIRRQLGSAGLGYRVLEASHGAGAMEMIRRRRPDLVLLDLGLPDQDGYTILRYKNMDPSLQQIPVVIISARDPLGGPVVTGRLRVEMVGGLSLHDIAECATALTAALLPTRKSTRPTPVETIPG